MNEANDISLGQPNDGKTPSELRAEMNSRRRKKTANRGLGSPNIDPATKYRIQSAGGKASHGGGRPKKVTQ